MLEKIDLIIISYNRQEELEETIENVLLYRNSINKIIIIDNASVDNTKEMLEKYKQDVLFEIILSDENLGVAGGRNLGIQKSNADILVFLDDDAVFNVKENPFEIVRKDFLNNSKLGIIAFKIVNFYSNEIQRHEFPFVDKNINANKTQKCAYYVGAGHAIKKEVFIKCGLYPEDYFYGKEELDLSLRAINKGYELLYEAQIEVLHKQSPKGRMKNDEKWLQVYLNRLVISYKYYPFQYKIVSNFLWFLKIVKITKNITIPLLSIKKYLNKKKDLEQDIIKKQSIKYIKKYKGRLFY